MTDTKPFHVHIKIPASNPELIVKIQGIENKNELVTKLLSDYFAGKLDNKTSNDSELKRLKTIDLKLKIWDKLKNAGYSLEQLKEILNGDELPHPEHRTFYADSESSKSIVETETKTETPKPTPPPLGLTITHQPNKILQEDGTLRCRLCNRRLDMRAYDFEQLDDYRKHFEQTHRALTDDERTELMELYN